MEEPSFSMDALYEKAKDYADLNLELAKLKAVNKAAEVGADLVPRLVVLVFLMLFVFCANIALGLWVGALLGGAHYGFAVLAAAYLLLGLLVRFLLRDRIGKNVSDTIVSRLLN